MSDASRAELSVSCTVGSAVNKQNIVTFPWQRFYLLRCRKRQTYFNNTRETNFCVSTAKTVTKERQNIKLPVHSALSCSTSGLKCFSHNGQLKDKLSSFLFPCKTEVLTLNCLFHFSTNCIKHISYKPTDELSVSYKKFKNLPF